MGDSMTGSTFKAKQSDGEIVTKIKSQMRERDENNFNTIQGDFLDQPTDLQQALDGAYKGSP